jgi:hypothetical protein
MSQSKYDVQADAQWSPWTPMADLERAAPLFALSSGQSDEELAGSLRHLRDLGLMQVRCDAAGQQQFRVRTDAAGRTLALLDDHARTCRN